MSSGRSRLAIVICTSTLFLLLSGIFLWKEKQKAEKVYSEAALIFDTCGYADQATCLSDVSCTAPSPYSSKICYKSASNGWCCQRGCTIETICGDTQITGTEECDFGGLCNGGGMNGLSCRTLNDVQKCAARGGLCQPSEAIPPFTSDGDLCDATCMSTIPTCTDGVCDSAQGETCRTCKQDCACGAKQTCNSVGQCVHKKGGGFCGDGIAQTTEQCDDSNLVNGDGCTNLCVCELCGDGYKCKSEECDGGANCGANCKLLASCSDGIKNQGEIQTDCGGPCPVCPCVKDADCNDTLYCTIDRCNAGFCQYTAYDGNTTGGTNVDPCATDFPRICSPFSPQSNCICNENTNACDLCNTTNKNDCKAVSNTLCQDHGNPNGCYKKSAGSWCCPGRE